MNNWYNCWSSNRGNCCNCSLVANIVIEKNPFSNNSLNLSKEVIRSEKC